MQKSASRAESRAEAISWLVSQLRWERMLEEFRHDHPVARRTETARAA